MTEIPEHLLKRSKERRAAMGSGGGEAAETPTEAAPAAGATAESAVEKPAAPKAPAPVPTLEDTEPPPQPDIAVVAAAKRRKRVPVSALVLALLPLWGFLYYFSVQPPPAGENDPLAIGQEVYTANCSGCHTATGAGVTGGGTGQQLNDGHAIETFADPLDMVHWIAFGSDGGARPDGTYGDEDRPGGAMNINTISGPMPAWGTTLTPEELAAVTIYVRQELSGGDPADDPNFNPTTFEADLTAAADIVQQVIDLGPTGDPDLADIAAAESGE